MKQSNYESYAESVQPKTLNKTVTLKEATDRIRFFKGIYSASTIDDFIDIVADLFDLTHDEIRGIVDGKEYWVV